MERRIERLDDRLRALEGALRLRGEWRGVEPDVTTPQGEASASQVLRLRRSGGTTTAG